eukprot:CAMPEP_0178984814 /NCGR_PEP_ID=MMETSP0795-20121207/1819_1 /TAXON_ID=88552 /ORGANISM="Amoebophrya sp., Strain Ameob2" /LENGTH=462 /DNA_ID=CAMNT_0020675729 /DNA_START=383 /DNA_END=1771 /DNA_ORIENTATION=-
MKAAYSTKNLSEVKHKQGAAPVGPTRLLLLTQLLAAVISFSTCCTTPVDAVGRVKISVSLTSLTGDLLTFDDEDSTSFEADPLLMTVDELQEKVFHAHMRHIEQKEKAVGPPTDEERYLTSYGFDGYKKMLSLVWYDPRGNPAARHDGTLDLGVVNVKVGPALLRTMRPYQTTVASSATLASAEGLQLLNYRLPHGGWPPHLHLLATFVDTLWEQCAGRGPGRGWSMAPPTSLPRLARALLDAVERNAGAYRRGPPAPGEEQMNLLQRAAQQMNLLQGAASEVGHHYDLFSGYPFVRSTVRRLIEYTSSAAALQQRHSSQDPQDEMWELGLKDVREGKALLVHKEEVLSRTAGLVLSRMAGLPNDQHEWVREVLSMESAPERVKYAVGHCWKAAVNAALMEKEESEAGEHKPRPLMLSPAAMAAALTREKELKKMLAEKLQPVFSVETFEARERFEDEDRPF